LFSWRFPPKLREPNSYVLAYETPKEQPKQYPNSQPKTTYDRDAYESLCPTARLVGMS